MNLLEDNFREIYQSVKFPSHQHFPLVANITGTRIYDSRYGWGRLWCWFYRVFDFITDYPWYLVKLKQAILHTHTLFNEKLTSLEPHLNAYKEYLSQRAKGYAVSEDLCFEAREQITAWNSATQPFLKLTQKMRADNGLIKIFQTSYALRASMIKPLQIFQHVIDLEGCCGAPLPIFAIKRILRNIPLNSIDQKELSKWVFKINKYEIPLRVINKALKAVVDFYVSKNTPPNKIQETLAAVELHLEEKGVKAFKENDPKHLKWRQGLQKGDVIHLNQTVITLGKEIFPKFSGSDQNRSYDIQEMPNHVAIIAHNRCALPLRHLRMLREKSFIASANFSEISLNGKVAIMERLKSANELQWTSTRDSISQKDTPLVEAIVKLVKEFISQNVTPSNFSLSLMFDDKLQFKCTKPITLLPFDFNEIEDFIHACSAGNSTIFQELMVRSGLVNHPSAKFYKEIVSNALKGEKIAVNDLAAIYKISDSKVVDRAIKLADKIRSEKKQLLLTHRKTHPKQCPNQLNTQANEEILKRYQCQCLISRW